MASLQNEGSATGAAANSVGDAVDFQSRNIADGLPGHCPVRSNHSSMTRNRSTRHSSRSIASPFTNAPVSVELLRSGMRSSPEPRQRWVISDFLSLKIKVTSPAAIIWMPREGQRSLSTMATSTWKIPLRTCVTGTAGLTSSGRSVIRLWFEARSRRQHLGGPEPERFV